MAQKKRTCMIEGCESKCPAGWATCKPCAAVVSEEYHRALEAGKKRSMAQTRKLLGLPAYQPPKPKPVTAPWFGWGVKSSKPKKKVPLRTMVRKAQS